MEDFHVYAWLHKILAISINKKYVFSIQNRDKTN